MEYFSCEWIEHRLVLDIFELKFCCIPHSNGAKGFVPICKFEGGKLPLGRIDEARKKLTELNNREDADSPCKGCHFLQKKEWEKIEGNARYRQVEISNFSLCNLKCVYCYTVLHEDWDLPREGYDLAPVFKDMIENGSIMEDATVGWGGGEPTILKNFNETARLLLDTGLNQRIFTNAVRFSEVIEEGLRQGKITITTSVDAGTRKTFEEIKGRDRFDVVWKNLARYAQTGGEVIGKYVARKGNSSARDIKQFVRKCAEVGIREVYITPDMEEIGQNDISEETIYAFALMLFEAKKSGIEPRIGREYLSPENLEQVSKYDPLDWMGRCKYSWIKAREAMYDRARKTRRLGLQLLKSASTRKVIKRAEACIAGTGCDPDTISELLDFQTRSPNPVLRARLAELVASKDIPGKQEDGKVNALGLSADAWTLDREPCFLVVGNESSGRALTQELWISCDADAEALPLKVTISDGIHKDIVHSFEKPGQTHVLLPAVPSGQNGIFVVRTDRTWIPGNGDSRNLGVHLSSTP